MKTLLLLDTLPWKINQNIKSESNLFVCHISFCSTPMTALPPLKKKKIKKISTLNSWNLQMFPYGGGIFINAIKLKDLGAILSWIVWVGPKSNDECLYKRHIKTHKGEQEHRVMWPWRQRLQCCGPEPWKLETLTATRSWKGKGEILLWSLQIQPWWHPDLALLPSRTVRK